MWFVGRFLNSFALIMVQCTVDVHSEVCLKKFQTQSAADYLENDSMSIFVTFTLTCVVESVMNRAFSVSDL